MRYKHISEGEWVQPKRKKYLMKCCDCGLVHRLVFRLVKWGNGHKIQFQAFRHNHKKGLPKKKSPAP